MIWIQEICGLLPLTRNTMNMIATKNTWTNRQEISLITGRISTLNTTFFTR